MVNCLEKEEKKKTQKKQGGPLVKIQSLESLAHEGAIVPKHSHSQSRITLDFSFSHCDHPGRRTLLDTGIFIPTDCGG